MPDIKTRPAAGAVEDFLASHTASSTRLEDCRTLIALMSRITGCPPVMWGSSIVGFGSYHYKYASGREGDSCLLGFSPRKTDFSIYVVAGFDDAQPILDRLGRFKTSKACLYVKRLADIDLGALESLLRHSALTTLKRYP